MNAQVNIDQANTDANVYGAQAITKWASRDKSGAQGDALGFLAIIHAYETMSFTCDWKEKEGTERLDFDMKDYMHKPCMNANHTRNNKATKARTEAIMSKVFGVSDPTPAQLQSLRRVVEMVKNFVALGGEADQVKLTSRGYLEVPYALMHDEPKENATEREIKTWEKNKDDTEVLDNTSGMSVTKFAQRIAPKTARVASAGATAKETSDTFVASINYVSAILDRLNKDDGESDLAPTDTLRQSMHDLQVRLQTYFKADPIEAKGKGSKVA